MFLKPIHQWLRGVAITTLNPQQKQLLFLMPRLGTKGDKAREALRAYEDYEKTRQRVNELKEKKELDTSESMELKTLQDQIATSREQQLILQVAIESLKQQYLLEPNDKNDPMPESPDEIKNFWHETVCSYFTEDDLLRIIVSMRLGKEVQTHELYDMIKSEQFKEKKS